MIKNNFLKRDGKFMLMMAIFAISCAVFYQQPQIAMWIGFGLAGYSAIANDSIQTLGTFISSNKKSPWWLLWIFLGSIMAAVLIYGWHINGGDPAYGRLSKIPQPDNFYFLQLLAPVILLILTHYRMPVSTTFLLLSVFSNSKTIGKMLVKTFTGYFVAFIAAFIIWFIIAQLQKREIFFKKKYNKKAWRILQWFATAYLWTSWLMQDLANITVYLPRSLTLTHIIGISAFIFALMGILLYLRGGRIQSVINEKTDVIEVRAATIIDFVFGTLLIYFKNLNDLPMSTTWVFLGMLAGREIALSQISGHNRPYLRTLGLVTKDLVLAGIGLIISIAIAWMVRGDFGFGELLQAATFWT